MSIIINIYMFIVGTLLGSFYTLAVYRIPLKQDITHKRSFCPNCNHRLEFIDLIPILSYVFLGGKCRYCKKKIRPRYLILEILSGFCFLLLSILLNIDILEIDILKVITLIFGIFFFSTIFIVCGIYKEYKNIQKNVFNFGIIVEIIYMIYLYILNTSIYRYIIYLLMLIGFIIVNNKNTKKIIKNTSFIIYVIIGLTEIINIII